MLAVYVSAHGFGHATRTAEVLRTVRARAADLPIVVSTSAPAFLFEGLIAPPLAVRRVECDVGLVQRDALVIDEPGTVAAWRSFDGRVGRPGGGGGGLAGRGGRPARPRRHPAARVHRGGGGRGCRPSPWATSRGTGIYAHLGAREPALFEGAARAREAYARADLLLRLPFAGDLSAFRRVEDVPLVARKPAVARAEARTRLGLDARPAVLVSFGGLGLPGLQPAGIRRADRLPGPSHRPARGGLHAVERAAAGWTGARRRRGSTTRTCWVRSTWW